jgi:hypothetical protein
MVHLTNFSLNVNSEKFKFDNESSNDLFIFKDFFEENNGDKRLLSQVFHNLQENGTDISKIQ